MQQRSLGRKGLTVPAIGFGCASLSSAYGPSDDEESVAAIQHAISEGVNLLDTSDAYGNGHNESLVGRAIKGHRTISELASEFDTLLVPFFLEGVVFTPGFMQADGIHPSERGQPVMLENVWKVLAPALGN